MTICAFVHPKQRWSCPFTNSGLEDTIHDICTDCHTGTEDSRIPQLLAKLLTHLCTFTRCMPRWLLRNCHWRNRRVVWIAGARRRILRRLVGIVAAHWV